MAAGWLRNADPPHFYADPPHFYADPPHFYADSAANADADSCSEVKFFLIRG